MSITKTILSVLAAIGCAALWSIANAADVAVNGGWSSEYIFRGVPQSDSSVFAGLDIEQSGFYFGSWVAEVGESSDGLEVDFFAGYSGEWKQLDYGLGVTSYQYTDDFDDEYFEINLNVGYGFLNFAIAIGEYDNFSGPTLDYRYYTLSAEHKNLYASTSLWADDYDGEVFEIGYKNTLRFGENEIFDYSFAVIHGSRIEILNDSLVDSDISFVLSLRKSFSLN